MWEMLQQTPETKVKKHGCLYRDWWFQLSWDHPNSMRPLCGDVWCLLQASPQHVFAGHLSVTRSIILTDILVLLQT